MSSHDEKSTARQHELHPLRTVTTLELQYLEWVFANDRVLLGVVLVFIATLVVALAVLSIYALANDYSAGLLVAIVAVFSLLGWLLLYLFNHTRRKPIPQDVHVIRGKFEVVHRGRYGTEHFISNYSVGFPNYWIDALVDREIEAEAVLIPMHGVDAVLGAPFRAMLLAVPGRLSVERDVGNGLLDATPWWRTMVVFLAGMACLMASVIVGSETASVREALRGLYLNHGKHEFSGVAELAGERNLAHREILLREALAIEFGSPRLSILVDAHDPQWSDLAARSMDAPRASLRADTAHVLARPGAQFVLACDATGCSEAATVGWNVAQQIRETPQVSFSRMRDLRGIMTPLPRDPLHAIVLGKTYPSLVYPCIALVALFSGLVAAFFLIWVMSSRAKNAAVLRALKASLPP